MTETEWIIRLALALVGGSLVGIQRELTGHPAGLRTIALVSVGSALIMLTDIYVYTTLNTQDSFRLAAQVVTGVGFIGAGTILQTNASVQGLTTAATIWVSAGIGLAFGAGFYKAGGAVTLVSLLVLSFEPLERRLIKRRQRREDSNSQ